MRESKDEVSQALLKDQLDSSMELLDQLHYTYSQLYKITPSVPKHGVLFDFSIFLAFVKGLSNGKQI